MPVVEFYSVLLIALMGYLLPIGVAVFFKHRRMRPIVLVNIFAGWTVIGWFMALAMAFADQPAGHARPRAPEHPEDGTSE
ncbi:superinfection immunity protein [Rhodovibrio salinarum]|uniref:Superinfection immunity protein n=1 Tax=Rhodovibrio salinarum TaxID=1087 RepID=A0A934QJ73_9PROT|nr:superinfection immunity protein [Rhodovibrio salinarum]MBK1697550.1 superinfection immunity protein [Rhodovibrio salinarum]